MRKIFSLDRISSYGCLLLIAVFNASMVNAETDQPQDDDKLLLLNTGSLSEEDLAENRGKQGFDTLQQMNKNDQRAWLEDNKLSSGLTGNNVIENGALQGIEGISTVIQNTGNQVVIQESTLLNLTITP